MVKLRINSKRRCFRSDINEPLRSIYIGATSQQKRNFLWSLLLLNMNKQFVKLCINSKTRAHTLQRLFCILHMVFYITLEGLTRSFGAAKRVLRRKSTGLKTEGATASNNLCTTSTDTWLSRFTWSNYKNRPIAKCFHGKRTFYTALFL